MSNAPSRQSGHKRLAGKLLLAAVAMFGFGFALVPLYDVFCEVTGLNGKTGGRVEAKVFDSMIPAGERIVTIEFLANINENLPWEFKPKVTRMQVTPGKMYATSYYAENHSANTMTGQAIPSVTPGVAAKHLLKLECFCFRQQVFKSGEQREMPLQFTVDPKLPPEISTLTLAYTFFDAGKQARAD